MILLLINFMLFNYHVDFPDGDKIDLHSAQIRTMQSQSRYTCMLGGLQGGKSILGALWSGCEAEKQKYQYDGIIVAPRGKTLHSSTLNRFWKCYPHLQAFYNSQKGEISLEPYNSTHKIYIFTAEEPQQIVGVTAGWAWLDEAGLYKREAWLNVMARLNILQGRALLTTTFEAMHWLYHEFYVYWKRGDKDYNVIQFPSILNPAWSAEEFNKMKDRLSEDEFARRYGGEIRKIEGLVLREFSDANVIEEIPNLLYGRNFIGVDFGYGKNHPFVLLAINQSPVGRYTILDEISGEFLTQEEIKQLYFLKGWDKIVWTAGYYDPSDPYRANELKSFLPCPLFPANNDVAFGLEALRSIIKPVKGQVMFVVVRGRTEFIDEVELYHWDIKGVKPIKEYDHRIDAARYVVASLTSQHEEIIEKYIAGITGRKPA